jgi:hypothetical protein
MTDLEDLLARQLAQTARAERFDVADRVAAGIRRRGRVRTLERALLTAAAALVTLAIILASMGLADHWLTRRPMSDLGRDILRLPLILLAAILGLAIASAAGAVAARKHGLAGFGSGASHSKSAIS